MRSRDLENLAITDRELAKKYLLLKRLRKILKQAETSRTRAPRRSTRTYSGSRINPQRSHSG
jgi:hypothetical protein